jgi:hypothetical protein
MANDEDDVKEVRCEQHPDAALVEKRLGSIGDGPVITHYVFDCGCTVEKTSKPKKLKQDDKIREGVVVRFKPDKKYDPQELFRVRMVYTSKPYLELSNRQRVVDADYDDVEYVGEDTLSSESRYFPGGVLGHAQGGSHGPQRGFDWNERGESYEDGGYTGRGWGSSSWSGSGGTRVTREEPRSRDSISTGGLIKDEVKRLQKEDKGDGAEVRPLKTNAPTKRDDTKEGEEEIELAEGIPRRKGEW